MFDGKNLSAKRSSENMLLNHPPLQGLSFIKRRACCCEALTVFFSHTLAVGEPQRRIVLLTGIELNSDVSRNLTMIDSKQFP